MHLTERGHTHRQTYILTQIHIKLKYSKALIDTITFNNENYVTIIEGFFVLFQVF